MFVDEKNNANVGSDVEKVGRKSAVESAQAFHSASDCKSVQVNVK